MNWKMTMFLWKTDCPFPDIVPPYKTTTGSKWIKSKAGYRPDKIPTASVIPIIKIKFRGFRIVRQNRESLLRTVLVGATF